MPVVFRHGPYRFFFWSNEGDPREPLHIHVQAGRATAKIWLEPDVSVADAHGFDARALREIVALVRPEITRIRRAWNDHFS
jgi:hypothetical protein